MLLGTRLSPPVVGAFLLLIFSDAFGQSTSCTPLAEVPGIGAPGYATPVVYVPGSTVRIQPNDCQFFSTSYTALWSPGGQATPVLTVTVPPAGVSQTYTLRTTSGTQMKTGSATISGAPNGSPNCSLSVPTTSVAVGQPVTVTASCVPAATTLAWSGSFTGNYTLVSGQGTTQATYVFLRVAGGSGWIIYLDAYNAAGKGPDKAVTFAVTSAASLTPSASISAGGFHTCATDSQGGAYCWGDNSAGEVGDGSTVNRNTPVRVANDIVAISAGRQDHTCAIGTDSVVRCWGDNQYGQLGDGTTTNRLGPNIGPGLATAVAAGGYHTCALYGGGVKCWGYNGFGQIGNGDLVNRSVPTPVSGLSSGIAAIATGFSHSCALTAAGGVKCWGDNRYGQLGDGSLTNRNTPVDVAGLSSGVSSIALGIYHSCALLSGGAVRCWGKNESGQLGDGSTTDRAAPVGVAGVSGGATFIAGGGFHTCAVFTGGAASCWGSNTLGQVGDGSVVNRPTPASVTGLSQGVVGLKAGGYHTCARVTDGGVRCWGSSSGGQLGDGGLSAHPIARYVLGVGGSGYFDTTPENPVAGPPPATQPFIATLSASSAIVPGGNSTALASVQFRAQDVGKQYFVYFLAPTSLAKSVERESTIAEPTLTPKDGPTCVLARLTSTGLQRVTAGTPLTAAGNIVSSAGQAVSVLNNVPTGQITGASACIGAGASATEATAAGNNQCVVTVQGAETCVSNDDTALGPAANIPGALSGLWYNAAESGWGINFTQRRNIIFAAWYTYDGAGSPKWYVAPSCTLTTTSGAGACSGSLYEVSGPTFFGGPFNPGLVNARATGTADINFLDTGSGSFKYTVGGQTRTVTIVRQPLTSGTTPPNIDYTDLWWNPGESGWGMAITHQFGVMFLAWYVYDSAGKPVWYVASNCTVSGNGCSGALYRTTGPALGPTFNPAQVQVFPSGTVSLNFSDANNGTLSYIVNGVSASKSITRQLF